MWKWIDWSSCLFFPSFDNTRNVSVDFSQCDRWQWVRLRFRIEKVVKPRRYFPHGSAAPSTDVHITCCTLYSILGNPRRPKPRRRIDQTSTCHLSKTARMITNQECLPCFHCSTSRSQTRYKTWRDSKGSCPRLPCGFWSLWSPIKIQTQSVGPLVFLPHRTDFFPISHRWGLKTGCTTLISVISTLSTISTTKQLNALSCQFAIRAIDDRTVRLSEFLPSAASHLSPLTTLFSLPTSSCGINFWPQFLPSCLLALKSYLLR